MAEFTEVMKQAKRLCKTQATCRGCQLNGAAGCAFGINPANWGDGASEAIERIIMDWAAAHPEPRYPSWNEWQTANFPDGYGNIPPCRFVGKKEMERINGMKCERLSCWKCANNPIPADIAGKLGVKPIGGAENA